MTLAKNLQPRDKIFYDNKKLTVVCVEVSKIGKHGKAKCRLDTIDENNEKKVFITLADEDIPLQ